MSLIEKALNKSQSPNYSPGSTAPLQVPSPGNLVGPSGRPPRFGLMVTLGVLIGLVVVGAWLIMEYWPLSHSQEPRGISRKEPLQAPKQAPDVTQDSDAKKGPKEMQGEKPALEVISPEPPEESGTRQGASFQGRQGSLTPKEPDRSMGDLKNPSLQRSQEKSQPNKPQHEASPPRGAMSSEKKKEPRPGAQEKHSLLLEKAYIQAQAGRLQEALGIYDQILAQDPGQLEALVNRGVLRMRMGDIPGAKRDLLEAKHLQPQDSTLLNALGVLCLETGELEEAVHYFRSSPEPASLVNLALVYWRKGSHERALELLEEAQGRIPQDPWLVYYKALLMRELGKQKQAQTELEKARGLALRRGDMELVRKLEAAQGGP